MGLLLLSPTTTTPTPTTTSAGNRWIAIARIFLDSGAENVSGGPVNHPTRTYEGRVLNWGSIEASIPTPSAIPRIGDAVIRVADTDRRWRDLLSLQTPRRRIVTVKFMEVGASESAADVVFSGEVKDATFPEGIVDHQLRDTTFSWIDERLPELVNQQNFPTFPDVNPAFFPVVMGHCQSRAIPPGSASGGPTKDPTGDSAAMAAKIASAAALIAAYTAYDVTAPGPSNVDKWVIGIENPYGQALALVIDEINRQWSNGAMLLADLTDARDAVQDNIDAFLAKAAAVGAINSDWLQITNQAVQNQHNIFGNSFELLIDPINAKIDVLTSSPTAIASYVQGVIPLPHVGYLLGTGDRWAASVHQLWNVLAIYRKLPNETIFTVVDPAEFNVVEEVMTFIEWPGETFTCVFIDFIAQQPDGTEIRMDADGFYFRDTWNGMAAAGYNNTSSPPLLNQGPLRNPIDAFIHLTRVLMLKASAETGWDGSDVELVYNKLATGTDFTPPYYCDGAIVEAITSRELLGLFMQSFGLDFTTKQTGLQSLAFLDAEDPSRPQITEQMMVKLSFVEHLANPTVNQLVYSFARDYAEDKWLTQAVYDNAYDQTLLGEIEKGELELWFVRDQGTAISVAGRFMQYVSLGSYQQEWKCPLPLVLDRMELAQQVGITHRQGLEYSTGYDNREVKIIGRTIDLGRMEVAFRSILRVPVRIAAAAPTFGYYSDFIVNASQVPSAQTAFPVGIVWTDSRFKNVAYGGHVESLSGYDLRPYDFDGTNPLTFELVWYDPTTGAFEMWVLMASIEDADVIRMKYGSTSITTDGSSDATWPSTYNLVQHYGSPTSLTLEDSTPNGNDGTGFNSPTASAGQLGGAVNLELASSQYVEIADTVDLRCSNTDSMTWEFWIERSGVGTPLTQVLFDKRGSGPARAGWLFYLSGGGNPDIFRVKLIADSGVDEIYNSIVAFTITADWTYFVITYDGSGANTGLKVWRNDIDAPMNRTGSLSGDSSGDGSLDLGQDNGGGTFFDGRIDEFRVSKGIVRSDDYKTTAWNNQSSMVGFWTLDTEVVS